MEDAGVAERVRIFADTDSVDVAYGRKYRLSRRFIRARCCRSIGRTGRGRIGGCLVGPGHEVDEEVELIRFAQRLCYIGLV